MKNHRLLTVLAVVGSLAFAVARVQAAHDVILNIKLTIMVQDLIDEQVGNSDVYKSTVFKVKVTNKDIVSLLENAYDTTFPGCSLAIDYYAEDFVIVDNNGNTVVNVTHGGFIAKPFVEMSDDVFSGTENHSKPIKTETRYCTCPLLQFADVGNGVRFTVRGFLEMTYSINGDKEAFSIKLSNGAGDGLTVSDGPLVLSGTISGKAVN